MARLKQSLQATTTVQTTVNVALKPNTRLMVKQRVEEYAKLSREVKAAKQRQERIRDEVDALFTKDKQGKALADGTVLDGYKLKMVCGTTKKLDQHALMKEHGLTQADLDACTDEVPSKAYVKITPPGEKED
jgi:hypothetical protein